MNLWFFSYGLQSPEILLIRGPEEYHQKSHVRRLDSHHLQPIHPLEKYNYNCERLEIADIGQLHQFWFKKKKRGGYFILICYCYISSIPITASSALNRVHLSPPQCSDIPLRKHTMCYLTEEGTPGGHDRWGPAR